MKYLALAFALAAACTVDDAPDRAYTDEWSPPDTGDGMDLIDIRGPDDFRGNTALLDCMERAAISDVEGDTPPDIQGSYHLTGSGIVSDYGLAGTAVDSQICIADQAEDNTLTLAEDGQMSDAESVHAWITGHDSEFAIWGNYLVDDSYGCTNQSLAIFAGTVDESGNLSLLTAAVPIAYSPGCGYLYEDMLYTCWATEDTATLQADTCE